jgi:hypothetical protein
MPLSKIKSTSLLTGAVETYLGTQNIAFGFKNRLINGQMLVAQYGSSGTITSGATGVYTMDRWQHRSSGSTGGTTTFSQVYEASTGLTKLRLNYSGATGTAYIQQKIEAQFITDLWGNTVTFSFYSNDTLADIDLYSYDATGTEAIIVLNAKPTSLGGNRYSYTLTLPVPAGGTRSGNNIGLLFVIKMKGGAVPSNSTNYDYWNIQLEKGSITPFEYRPYPVELALCQRYYWRFVHSSTSSFTFGHQQTTNLARFVITTPVPMRTTPTVATNATLIAIWVASGGTSTSSALSNLSIIDYTGSTACLEATVTGFLGFGVGYGYGGYTDYRAEL